MNKRTRRDRPLVRPRTLNTLAAAALAMAGWMPFDAAALALGRLAVQSSLGETLRAEIDVTALTPEEAASLKVRIASPEAYRTAGVDYNPALSTTNVSLQRRADGRPYLQITSDRAVQEPFVDVILDVAWSSGRLVREFTLLVDPPSARAAAPASAPATMAPAPTSPPAAAAPRPEPAAAASAPAPRAAAAAPSEPRPGAAAVPNEYRVERGDTLFRIAARVQRPGTSLDQMLVALYRSNSGAFMGNMNLLKAGAVLTVPGADDAKAVSPTEARQLIQAQSADFGAYRQKLARNVPTTTAPDSARASGGTVQAEVQDPKAAATSTPDKLTLSKGAAASRPGAEDQLAKRGQQKDSASRVAELAKNVEDLKKLQGTAAAASSGAAAKPGVNLPAGAPAAPAAKASAPLVAVAPAVKPAPVPVAAPSPSPPPPPPAPAPEPAPPAAPVPSALAAPPSVAVPAPTTPSTAAPEPAAVTAAEPASAPAVGPASAAADPMAPKPPVPTDMAEGPSFVDGLVENPFVLPGALIAVLLAGFGFYRMRQNKRDTGETSFLESRLQPDSFFGASGGQRVDTRDATGVPSSMSYSLSQLDAIGDVDPVAEADVYLAYGRDLQAEEILKEAMRANPERMAIRLKLLEVYAKRRDTKGFELLATQLYALAGGDSDDWSRAQQLGLGIDSDNPMYQPGGRPEGMDLDAGAVVEALGASTMPQSVLPTPSRFAAQRSELPEDPGVDLDLDVSTPSLLEEPQRPSPERTQPMAPIDPVRADKLDDNFDFDLPSLSLDGPADSTTRPTADDDIQDLGNMDLPEVTMDDEALERKVELAEEFKQIGDLEGARDLLQEVASQSTGALRAKAQSMLKDLG